MALRFRVALAYVVLAGLFGTVVEPAAANPTGGTVIAGSAAIHTSPRTVTVRQNSNRAIINWQSFSIGSGEVTRFKQPSSTSAVLNRVTTSDPSAIYGTLKSNGQVYLLNPNGILIGPDGRIKTGGFIASTLDANNASFMAGGPLTLFGSSSAGIVNLGTIRASSGDVGLFATQVQNAGTITAPDGTVALASGGQILYSPGDGDGTITIQAPPMTQPNGTAVDNEGVITAAAAQLEAAGGNPYALAVNNGGAISATTVHNDGGRVIIDGGTGATTVSGTIDADATGSGNGGSVTVKGANTTFSGTISARGGPTGGNGGSAEISGNTLTFTGNVDLRAPHGITGLLLLDPTTIDASSIDTPLSTANVDVVATDSITVTGAIDGSVSGNSLTLDAPTIAINAPITLGTGTGATLVLQNTSPTTAGSSLTSASGAGILANLINVAGPFATTTFNGSLNGVLGISTPGFTATSFTATNGSNSIGSLIFGSGTQTTATGSGIITAGVTPGTVGSGGTASFSGAVSIASNADVTTVLGQPTAGSFSIVGGASTGGDLALGSGTVLTSSGTTTLAAINGGVFINNAGASALAGAGRKVIYSYSDGADSAGVNNFILGGLSGFTQYNPVSYNSDPIGSGNEVYFATATLLPPLTITANDLTRLYGGADAFTSSFSTGNAASDLSFPVQYRIQQGSDANVGTYTIVPYGAVSSQYAITYATGTLTVKPAPLTVTADDQTRTYGDPNPILTSTISGLANGDTSSVISGLSLSTTAINSSSVGSYAINVAGTTNSNYTLQLVNGTLTVNPATLFYTVNNASMIFGQPVPNFTVSYSGLQPWDTSANVCCILLQTNFTSASAPGTYQITAEAATKPGSNYALVPSSPNGGVGTLVVSPVPPPPPPTQVITIQGQTTTNAPTVNVAPQTNFIPTLNDNVVVALNPLGLSDPLAVAEEEVGINAYLAAMANAQPPISLSDVQNLLADPDTRNAMLGALLPYIYNDLTRILDETTPTAQETAFVNDVLQYIQAQKVAAANTGEAELQAWLTQQNISFAQTGTSNAGFSGIYIQAADSTNPQVPPPDFLAQIQAGMVMTNSQAVSSAALAGQTNLMAEQQVYAQESTAWLALDWLLSNKASSVTDATTLQNDLLSGDPAKIQSAFTEVTKAYAAAGGSQITQDEVVAEEDALAVSSGVSLPWQPGTATDVGLSLTLGGIAGLWSFAPVANQLASQSSVLYTNIAPYALETQSRLNKTQALSQQTPTKTATTSTDTEEPTDTKIFLTQQSKNWDASKLQVDQSDSPVPTNLKAGQSYVTQQDGTYDGSPVNVTNEYTIVEGPNGELTPQLTSTTVSSNTEGVLYDKTEFNQSLQDGKFFASKSSTNVEPLESSFETQTTNLTTGETTVTNGFPNVSKSTQGVLEATENTDEVVNTVTKTEQALTTASEGLSVSKVAQAITEALDVVDVVPVIGTALEVAGNVVTSVMAAQAYSNLGQAVQAVNAAAQDAKNPISMQQLKAMTNPQTDASGNTIPSALYNYLSMMLISGGSVPTTQSTGPATLYGSGSILNP